MQHERLFTLAFDRIDDLGITARAKRGNDNRLGLTASKDSGSVCTRQYPNASTSIRTNRGFVSTVNARLAFDDSLNEQWILLKLRRQCAFDVFSRPGRIIVQTASASTAAAFDGSQPLPDAFLLVSNSGMHLT